MTVTRTRLIRTVLVAALLFPAIPPSANADDPARSADSGVVVRIQPTASIDEVTEAFPVQVDHPLLTSRGIYLLTVTDPKIAGNSNKTAELARKIARFPAVDIAEPNYRTTIADRRFHSWPEGAPVDAGTSPEQWETQPITSFLDLSAAHQIATGEGSVVAVMDTGADMTHPALADRLIPGYDYVDDDPDPSESLQGEDTNNNGILDEAYGHGTFVASTVALVAPGAKIMPMRVLDSDGVGDSFILAEAISDAVSSGADVINLSLGSSSKHDSKILKKIIKDAQDRGVIVVAAAGNASSYYREYPAQNKNVIAVASTTPDGTRISEFSNWGDWVTVAAPAERVFGAVPGGRYAWWAGTSVAAPQVSGQVALIRTHITDSKTVAKAITSNTKKLNGNKKIQGGAIGLLASLKAVALTE